MIVLLMLCWSFIATAQQLTDTIAANGVYLTEDDFVHRKLFLPFEKNDKPNVRFRTPIGHNNELWVKTKDTIYKFPDDKIWGYRKDGVDQRTYHSEDYKVEYTGKIIIYSTWPDPTMQGSSSTSYFSKNLHTPVYELSRKTLKTVYHDNTRFVERINRLRFFQSLFKINKKTGQYRFIDWL